MKGNQIPLNTKGRTDATEGNLSYYKRRSSQVPKIKDIVYFLKIRDLLDRKTVEGFCKKVLQTLK